MSRPFPSAWNGNSQAHAYMTGQHEQWFRMIAHDRHRMNLTGFAGTQPATKHVCSSVPTARSYVSPGCSDVRVANVAEPWVRGPPKPKSPNGAALIRAPPFSIPNIPFINLNSMSLAQLTEFILERNPLVVVLLVGNVTFDLLDV